MSLRAVQGRGTVFVCDHPGCRFKGDAVALVSVARNVTPREAIELFKPGGELSDCLSEPLTTEEIEAYVSNANAQASVKAYLEKCRRAARISPEKARIRTGLSQSTAKLLHPGVALFVGGEPNEVPKCLSEFLKPKYRGSCLVLYPYTRDGDVTKIDVVDANNPGFLHTVVVTHPNLGVFGEDLSVNEKTVIAFENPKAAAAMYAANALMSVDPLPAVSFQGYPLPESMCDAQNVRLVSTANHPVSTKFLVDLLSAPNVATTGSPCFKVFKLDKRTDEVTAHEIAGVMQGKLKNWDPVELLARRLVDMIRAGQHSDVASMLAEAQTPLAIRNLLREIAISFTTVPEFRSSDSAPAKELVELLSSSKTLPVSDIRLANGRTLHRGATEIYSTSTTGRGELLCNVGLSVDSKIVSSDDTEILVCTATHADSDVPAVTVKIPECCMSDHKKIERLVSKAFSAKGCNPYVAFYTIKGYAWRDILSRFSEHCPVSREIDCLGIDSASNIHLPDVTVRADGTISPQSRIFTLPECAMRTYSGIPFETDAGVAPFVNLLSNCDNLYVAAFALGVMHVVYQMTFGAFKPEVAKNHMMRHLFYVETEPGIWGAVFRQLSELFGGNNFTPTVNYSDPGKTFGEYSKLGCLPLLAYLPTIGNKLSAALDCSGVDLVGMMDTSTAVMTNGKVSAVYVTPSEDTPMTKGVIDGRDIEGLRKSFATFLSKFVTEARIDTSYRSSSMPCLSAYDEACRILGVERSPLVDRIAKNYFPGVGMNGATILYDLLHRSLVDDIKPHVCIVNGEPQRGYSFTRRGQHVFVMKDVVVVSHMVADIYNQASKGEIRFDVEQLTAEMEATGVLADMPDLGIDESRCWCLRREAWETRIVRPPINLLEEMKSGTITLEPIKQEKQA